MRLQVVRIADRGVPNKERLHVSVLQDTNLSYFVVLLSAYGSPNSVTNGALQAFWFSETPVKAGDQVILHSGSGTYNARTEPNGSTVHFFYWNQPKTVWHHPSQCAVLFEVSSWATSVQGG